MSSKNHEASSMFLEPDPVPQGREVPEWRPEPKTPTARKYAAKYGIPVINIDSEEPTLFGFYHPATTQRGGCYAE
jgi:hypothetical protein